MKGLDIGDWIYAEGDEDVASKEHCRYRDVRFIARHAAQSVSTQACAFPKVQDGYLIPALDVGAARSI